MKLEDIIFKIDVPKRTLYRWMEKHPNVSIKDTNSLLGHPFPAAIGRKGKEKIWDAATVDAWWHANARSVGRHPLESSDLTLALDLWGSLTPGIEFNRRTNEDGFETIDTDWYMIKTVEIKGSVVRVTFRSAVDAMKFKLKYY